MSEQVAKEVQLDRDTTTGSPRATGADRVASHPSPPPPELRSAIGLGDFESIGRQMVGLVRRYAGLRRGDRVLDIGCGLGRLAQPLREELGARGRYLGVDIVRRYVDWCTREISSRDPRFTFQWMDVENREYNPDGSIDSAAAAIDAADGGFSLVIASSLFTHLLEGTVVRYLM